MPQRTLLATLAVALTVGLVVSVDRVVGAASYPASYWMARPMSVPVPMCVNAAGKALSASGVSSITKDNMSTGGYTATTRGYIVCVRLPKAVRATGTAPRP